MNRRYKHTISEFWTQSHKAGNQNTEIKVQKFIVKSKQEIEDKGFTKRVMDRLPVRKHYDWIIVVFAFLASLIVGIIGFNTKLSFTLPRLDESQLWLFVGAICVIPFIGLIQVLRRN